MSASGVERGRDGGAVSWEGGLRNSLRNCFSHTSPDLVPHSDFIPPYLHTSTHPPKVMAIDPKWLVELAPHFFTPPHFTLLGDGH